MPDAEHRAWPPQRTAISGGSPPDETAPLYDPPHPEKAWRRAALAGSILLACLTLRAALDTALPRLPPFITIFPAVAITGLVAGTRAGAVVCALGLLAADYFWISPRWAFGPTSLSDTIALGLYVAASACILTATHSSRAARRRAQDYFETAEIMLVVVGVDRRIKAINRHGVATLGAASASDLVGQDWFECCVPAEEREARLRAWSQAVGNFTLAPYEAEIVRRDGSRRLMCWRQTILRDARGRPTAVLASGDDVTDARATIAALRRSEARLHAVLRQIPAAVAIIEPPDGRLALRSDRSEDVLGHQPALNDDAVYWRYYRALHPDGTPFADTDYPIMRALLRGETVEADQFKYRKPDGTLIDLEAYAAPIHDEDGTLLAAVGIAFDISLRAKAERKLRVMLDEREMLLREADHRIKNSLQLVLGMLSLQRRHATSQETADALAATISRVNAVAEAHLALQLSDDLQSVDFPDMLAAICRRLDALSDTVRVICNAGSPVMLEIDRAIPLAMITSELITNALRHAYGGKQEGEVHVTASLDAGEMVLIVRDFGAGFEGAAPRPGLGSRVTGSLATKIGCTLHTQSRPGEGTAVTVRLRAAAPWDPPQAATQDLPM
jgi:PAS domain S-box-containing protein